MTRPLRFLAAPIIAGLLLASASPVAAQLGGAKRRETLFVGIDTSGSFRQQYDDAMTFLAYYIYGHLKGLGGLSEPRDLFVAAIGGREPSEPKAFRPIHDFAGKDIAEIEADLRKSFVPTDGLTDFNPFFAQVARIAKERNLVLSTITAMVVSDGVPDIAVRNGKKDPMALYRQIDLAPLEYLSRNITVRLAYASPKVGENWRKYVPRHRVRLWTTEVEVMNGWSRQLTPDAPPAEQARLWKWVRDNVDFRVRSHGL
jgi:hypothetical protein